MKNSIIILFLSAALIMPTASPAQQLINESRPAPAGGVVFIENICGSVTLGEWNNDMVEVTGTLAEDGERLEFTSENGRTKIRVVVPDMREVDDSDLVIRVPIGSRIVTETVSADIKADQLSGSTEFESVSGAIEVTGTPSRLEAETVSGDIKVSYAPPRTEIASVSGDITVHDGTGRLEAGTVSGNIEITAPTLDGAEIETVSGTAQLTTDLTGSDAIEMESVSGSVILIVPSNAVADFDLSTFSGRIRNQIGPQAVRTSRYTPGEESKFSTGNGGPQVVMASFSGTVKLVTE